MKELYYLFFKIGPTNPDRGKTESEFEKFCKTHLLERVTPFQFKFSGLEEDHITLWSELKILAGDYNTLILVREKNGGCVALPNPLAETLEGIPRTDRQIQIQRIAKLFEQIP